METGGRSFERGENGGFFSDRKVFSKPGVFKGVRNGEILTKLEKLCNLRKGCTVLRRAQF